MPFPHLINIWLVTHLEKHPHMLSYYCLSYLLNLHRHSRLRVMVTLTLQIVLFPLLQESNYFIIYHKNTKTFKYISNIPKTFKYSTTTKTQKHPYIFHKNPKNKTWHYIMNNIYCPFDCPNNKTQTFYSPTTATTTFHLTNNVWQIFLILASLGEVAR